LVRLYGKPGSIVSDNGTEFTSKALLKWAKDNDVEWHYEPRRVCRRLIFVSYAAMASVSRAV
jgi:transposase InsO family protein